MDVRKYLEEQNKQPTFTARQVYGFLRSLEVVTSTDLVTVIEYLQAECARFRSDELRWLTNKIQELSVRYMDEQEKRDAVERMKRLVGKRTP